MHEISVDLEEALTIVWKQIEIHNNEWLRVKEIVSGAIGENTFDELIKKGLVEIGASDNKITLTKTGYARAYDLTRRHRLTERLLVDVLGMDRSKVDADACKLEHIISKELEENICTLLGHPKVCPHGSPIMPGECCRTNNSKIERIIFQLSELAHGENGIVAYLQAADHPFMGKLFSLGLVPGVKIKVTQTFPAFVLEFEETQIAVEKIIADNIYVRRIS